MIKKEEIPAEPWPKINEYKENGITIKVYKPGYAEGVCMDHVVKKPRKGKY